MKNVKNTNEALGAALAHAILTGVAIDPELNAVTLTVELEADARTYELHAGETVGVKINQGTGRPVTVQVRPVAIDNGRQTIPNTGTVVTLTDHRATPAKITEWRAPTTFTKGAKP